MKRLLSAILGCVAFGWLASAEVTTTEYGFRFATNVTAKTYEWTNDNSYPFRIGALTFNSGAAVTSTLSLLRVHGITRQYAAENVYTTSFGTNTVIETNFQYIITNTVYQYATNVLLSATNTAGIYDALPSIYIVPGDRLLWDFGATNTISILFDGIR